MAALLTAEFAASVAQVDVFAHTEAARSIERRDGYADPQVDAVIYGTNLADIAPASRFKLMIALAEQFQMTELIGECLGEAEAERKAIADVEDNYYGCRDEYRELEGYDWDDSLTQDQRIRMLALEAAFEATAGREPVATGAELDELDAAVAAEPAVTAVGAATELAYF